MPKRAFLDTNVLVYSRDEASSFFEPVIKALQGLAINGVSLCIHRQILREYAVVATKPAPNGLGASIKRALTDIEEFEAAYLVLPDPEGVWTAWKQLTSAHKVTGTRLHDAYIAAVMSVYGISPILTLNTDDFRRFQAIKPVTPDAWHDIL